MPAPRPRARLIAPKGKRPVVSLYSSKEYQAWLKEAGQQLRGVVPQYFEGPVSVDLRFDVQRPKTTKLAAPAPDVDNYAKAVLDALTKDGRFWSDDSQVVELRAIKAWTTGTPGVHVQIRGSVNYKTITRVDFIAIHCSATPATSDIGAAEIRRWHRERGWRDIGYHYVIRRNGEVEKGRPDSVPGAHEPRINSRSLAICLVGGAPPVQSEAYRLGLGEDNYTDAQWAALKSLVTELTAKHPNAVVLGHRDVEGVRKACPSFDAKAWWEENKPQ